MPRNPANTDPDRWVLQLPSAPHNSVGWYQNENVEANGHSSPGRPNEDRYYTCFFDKKQVQIYIVLDGHEGISACDFAMKHIPGALLRQLQAGDEMMSHVIWNAYDETERTFFQQLDPQITRKVALQQAMEKVKTSHEAMTMFPHQVDEIARLDNKIKGGTTVVLAVIHNNFLHISNVGDSRAVLCYRDQSGVVRADQLSVDHTTDNEEELKRLERLGLNPESLRKNRRLGMQQNTRSIGDYSIKGGYKDVDIISHATHEPGIAEPFMRQGIPLHTLPPSFLILMTDGLYTAYQHYTNRPNVNQDLAALIDHEMQRTHDLNFIARSVIEKVKRLFCDVCSQTHRGNRIDDITLVIRNFNYPMGSQVHYPTASVVTGNPFFSTRTPVPPHPPTTMHRSVSEMPRNQSTHVHPHPLPPHSGSEPDFTHHYVQPSASPSHFARTQQDNAWRPPTTSAVAGARGQGMPVPSHHQQQQTHLRSPDSPKLPRPRSAGDITTPPSNSTPTVSSGQRLSPYQNWEPPGHRPHSDSTLEEQMAGMGISSPPGMGNPLSPPVTKVEEPPVFSAPYSSTDDNTLTGPPVGVVAYTTTAGGTLKGRTDSQSDEDLNKLMYGNAKEPSSPQLTPQQPVEQVHVTPPSKPVDEESADGIVEESADGIVEIPVDSDVSEESEVEDNKDKSPDGLIKSHVKFDKFPMDLSWDSL